MKQLKNMVLVLFGALLVDTVDTKKKVNTGLIIIKKNTAGIIISSLRRMDEI